MSIQRFTNLTLIFAKATLITDNSPILHEMAYLGYPALNNSLLLLLLLVTHYQVITVSAKSLCILKTSYEFCTKPFYCNWYLQALKVYPIGYTLHTAFHNDYYQQPTSVISLWQTCPHVARLLCLSTWRGKFLGHSPRTALAHDSGRV